MSEEIKEDKMVKAKKELEEILIKYNIVLVPVVIHQGDKTITRIDITPASQS
jgi:hypothetical protein